jgi:hypothetical protein
MIDGEHVPVNITWFFWWVGERGIAFGFEEEADSMVVGYSGTPLHKKLGFKPGAHVALVDVAEDVRAELADAVAQCQLVKTGNGPLDLGILTVTTQFQLRKAFASWKKQLTLGRCGFRGLRRVRGLHRTWMKTKCAKSDWRSALSMSKCAR